MPALALMVVAESTIRDLETDIDRIADLQRRV
jgi:hypothetical protein